MFVTSDIFDLETIGRFRGLDWQEHLLGGVNVHGTDWPGYQAGARFLFEAAKRCGLFEEMLYAGYSRAEDKRSRSIAPKSFERLVRGELAGAKTAVSALFRGRREAADAEMFNVRPLLNQAGLPLSCRNRVYRDLPRGLEDSTGS
jgi:hypothetical protein